MSRINRNIFLKVCLFGFFIFFSISNVYAADSDWDYPANGDVGSCMPLHDDVCAIKTEISTWSPDHVVDADSYVQEPPLITDTYRQDMVVWQTDTGDDGTIYYHWQYATTTYGVPCQCPIDPPSCNDDEVQNAESDCYNNCPNDMECKFTCTEENNSIEYGCVQNYPNEPIPWNDNEPNIGLPDDPEFQSGNPDNNEPAPENSSVVDNPTPDNNTTADDTGNNDNDNAGNLKKVVSKLGDLVKATNESNLANQEKQKETTDNIKKMSDKLSADIKDSIRHSDEQTTSMLKAQNNQSKILQGTVNNLKNVNKTGFQRLSDDIRAQTGNIRNLKETNQTGFSNITDAINNKEIDFSPLSTDATVPDVPEFNSDLPTDDNYTEYENGEQLATDSATTYAQDNLIYDPDSSPINAEITASGDPCINGNISLHGQSIPIAICFNKPWMLTGYSIMKILMIGIGYLQTAILLNKAIIR